LGLLILFRWHGDRNGVFLIYAGVSGRLRLVVETGSTFPHRVMYGKCLRFFVLTFSVYWRYQRLRF
jgi:hypothetical protein